MSADHCADTAHGALARPAAATGRSRASCCDARAASASARCPARSQPDATTTMVCGFCSTGCGLEIHLRDGEAVNLTPAPTTRSTSAWPAPRAGRR